MWNLEATLNIILEKWRFLRVHLKATEILYTKCTLINNEKKNENSWKNIDLEKEKKKKKMV